MSRNPKIDREVLMKQYLEAAEEAANTERLGNYHQACERWKEAKNLALTQKQQAWCQTRSAYCYTWKSKREKTQ